MPKHPIIDTHAHLCDPIFDPDRPAVLECAQKIGITKIISVSENINDARKNLELAHQFPILKPAAGLFPTNLDLDAAQELIDFIRDTKDKWIAIGEVGLDFWAVQDEKGKEIQLEIFGKFITLAIKLNIPLNVHSRSAGRQVIELLLRKGARKVQLHAFDGKASSVALALDAGYYFSVPPSTARSIQKQKLFKLIPLANLLVETDSPVLGAVPNERNEPANIQVSIDEIVRIKQLPPDIIRQVVYENTLHLYSKKILQ
jgi:TatD DNase family protein